jgi:hypothetical protein
MPDLQSDFVGRVSRLALKPNDKTALVPLMEANSVHAITERFDEDAGKMGRVRVTVLRDPEKTSCQSLDSKSKTTVSGSRGTITSHSSHQIPGTRKVGEVRVSGASVGSRCSKRSRWSVYLDHSTLRRRHFNFRLTEKEQVEMLFDTAPSNAQVAPMRIKFKGFDPRFSNRCPSKKGAVSLRLLQHFVPLFLSGNAPKVVIEDDEHADIEALFADSIVNENTSTFQMQVDDEPVDITLWSLKVQENGTLRWSWRQLYIPNGQQPVSCRLLSR